MPELLALEGGTPIRDNGFPAWPRLRQEQLDAALKVLRSGRLNTWTGQETSTFEDLYAKRLDMAGALAVSNGTVALEIALRTIGVQQGDEVIVTSRSFVASASVPALCGAVPVFADVDIESQNVTAATIEQVLTDRTRAIIVVHLYGWSCNMCEILDLARRHGIRVIEDCAQAHGGTWNGQRVGSIGDLSAFSFCNDKIITTAGEGGLVVARTRIDWETAWSLREHGKGYGRTFQTEHPVGYRLLHERLGTNARMTELQAAVGIEALKYLDSEVERRRDNAGRISACLRGLKGFLAPNPPAKVGHAFYKYCFRVDLEQIASGWSRHRVQQALNAEGIPCWSGYAETYREPVFANCGRWEPMLGARQLADSTLVLRVDPALGDDDIVDTCSALQKVHKVAFPG